MGIIYDWVKNIAFFMIFMTLLFQLMPGSSYHKYIRLFAGMVMIILVASPAMGFLDLDGDLESYFKNIRLSEDAFELKAQLEKGDEKRYSVFFTEYKNSIVNEIEAKALDEGLYLRASNLTIIEDVQSEDFGKLASLYLEVADIEGESLIYIEPITITGTKTELEENAGTKETEGLKKSLMRLYNLPEEKITIVYSESR